MSAKTANSKRQENVQQRAVTKPTVHRPSDLMQRSDLETSRRVAALPSTLTPRDGEALQRTVGNQNVTNLIQAQPNHKKSTAQHAAKKPAYRPDAVFSVQVIPGSEGPGIKREASGIHHKIFKGDTIVIRAKFKRLTTEQKESFAAHTTKTVVSGTDEEPELAWQPNINWESNTVHAWKFTASKVGDYVLQVGFNGPNVSQYEVRNVTVVSDVQDFALACTEAQSTLSGKFHRATRILNEAATAFRQAYAEQETLLSEEAARTKMEEEIVFGVLFAAAGGYAGGALATNLKGLRSLTKVDLKGEAQQLLSEAVIDSAKDTAKFAVRSLDKLRGGSKSKGSGASPSPDVSDPIRMGGGKYQPAGEHPQDFLTNLSSRVAAEGEAAQAVLTNLIHDARTARDANSKVDFDEDPNEVVNRGRMLDQLSNGLVTDKKVYLARLWKAWYINHGAWETVPLLNAIESAAKELGENWETWVPSRLNPHAEEEWHKQNPGRTLRPL